MSLLHMAFLTPYEYLYFLLEAMLWTPSAYFIRNHYRDYDQIIIQVSLALFQILDMRLWFRDVDQTGIQHGNTFYFWNTSGKALVHIDLHGTELLIFCFECYLACSFKYKRVRLSNDYLGYIDLLNGYSAWLWVQSRYLENVGISVFGSTLTGKCQVLGACRNYWIRLSCRLFHLGYTSVT